MKLTEDNKVKILSEELYREGIDLEKDKKEDEDTDNKETEED